MKITSVKTAATTGHCMHLWVRIETDAGITGLGECVHGGYQAIAIIKELEERLIGRMETMEHRITAAFRGEIIAAMTSQTRSVIFGYLGSVISTAGIVIAAAKLL